MFIQFVLHFIRTHLTLSYNDSMSFLACLCFIEFPPIHTTCTRIPEGLFSSNTRKRQLDLQTKVIERESCNTKFCKIWINGSKIYFQTKIHTIIAGGTKWGKSGVRNSSVCDSHLCTTSYDIFHRFLIVSSEKSISAQLSTIIIF